MAAHALRFRSKTHKCVESEDKETEFSADKSGLVIVVIVVVIVLAAAKLIPPDLLRAVLEKLPVGISCLSGRFSKPQ